MRSLGYVVLGTNEFYTSQKCPTCENFLGRIDIRRLYCPHCETCLHRDEAAGHNMCNIARSYILHQTRPLYLQPVDAEGNYPWMNNSVSSSSAGQAATTSTSTDADTSSSSGTYATSTSTCTPTSSASTSVPAKSASKSKDKGLKRVASMSLEKPQGGQRPKCE